MSIYGSAKYGDHLYGSALEHPYARVSGRVMWIVQVDWQRRGNFCGGETEPQAISKMMFKRGRERRLRTDGRQFHPGGEEFEIEIIDPQRRYDAFNSASPIYPYIGAPGLLLRVLLVNTNMKKTGAKTVFTGTLSAVEYDAKNGCAVLRGEGLAKYLEIGQAAALYAPCQSFSASAWDACFVPGATPFPVNYWKGRPGGLSLRACAALVLERAGWLLGAYYGSMVYNNEQPDYFYLDGSSAWETLKDLADGFAAQLFFLRDGRLFVMDRLDANGVFPSLAPPAAAQRKAGLKRISPFETLRNKVEVKVRNQRVYPFTYPAPTAAFAAAWVNAGPIAVEPNSYSDISIRYPDSLGKPLQGSFVRVNTDALTESARMQVWSAPDRTGTNMGAATGSGAAEYALITQQTGENSLGLTYVQQGNNQKYCTVRLRNYSSSLTAYFFDLQVQVVGIVETGAALSVIANEPASQALNGERAMTVNSRWIQNPVMAGQIADAYLALLADRERASPARLSYQWSKETLYDNLLRYDLGGFVDFGAGSAANFGLAGRWLIVGQELTWLSADGQDARITLTFEKEAQKNVLLTGSGGAVGAGVPSLTWSHTVSDGSKRALVVVVCKRAFSGTAAVQSIKYGGVSLTLRGGVQQGVGDYPALEIWYLAAPAVGTANLVLTLASGVDYMQAGSFSFENVDQNTPLGAPFYDWGASGPAVTNIAAQAGDLVLDGICYRNADALAGSAQTSQWSDTSDGTWKGAASTEPGAARVEMRWTIPAGGFAHMALAVKKAA